VCKATPGGVGVAKYVAALVDVGTIFRAADRGGKKSKNTASWEYVDHLTEAFFVDPPVVMRGGRPYATNRRRGTALRCLRKRRVIGRQRMADGRGPVGRSAIFFFF